MAKLTPAELENVFDFLELKRDEKLGCWVCGGNEWAATKIRNEVKEPFAHAVHLFEQNVTVERVSVLYIQLICKNCKQVAWFTDEVLDGMQ